MLNGFAVAQPLIDLLSRNVESALFAIQPLNRLDGLSTGALLFAAALAGVVVAAAYARVRPARTFVTALTPAPLVFSASSSSPRLSRS